MKRDVIPLGSTYRLQLSGLGFNGARALVGYLHDLGIQTLYLSPVLAASPGSTHGYDVIDPTRLDPALGTPLEFASLLDELEAHAMRALIDIVPNHMAASPDNAWWWDVLRLGQGSVFAPTFDIDWSRHVGRVLVPTLSRPLNELMEEIRYNGEESSRLMVIDGQPFPLAPGSRTNSELSAVLARQHYQPAYWRLSNHEGNYRRFFDIDGLIGVRVEDASVFERTHAFIAALGSDERVAGWRVDHVDGLRDPKTYLQRLFQATTHRTTRAVVLVEKIVSADEQTPEDWDVDGTTGYEFANLAGGLFVSDRGAQVLAANAQTFTDLSLSFAQLRLDAKREVLSSSFDAALERLVRLAMNALNESIPGHDLSSGDVRHALSELSAHLDVYRTYFSDAPPDAFDITRLERAVNGAQANLTGEAQRALHHIAQIFSTSRTHHLELVERWQQLTGAVMAKGAEDTATYRYSGLLSHAEVGCDPDHSSSELDDFYRFISHDRPFSSLNTTSTHDSKRSEDARARLFALSEVPEEWTGLVTKWQRRYRQRARTGPDGHDELVAYQSLACLWPLGESKISRALCRRVQDYVVKAAREAKRHTSWTDPCASYERSLISFVSTLARDDRFNSEMTHFMGRIGPAAATNSLALTVLKCVAPGVPDFYQGTELWDFSLTDPDNRRRVNFAQRRAMLAKLPSPASVASERRSAIKTMMKQWHDGAVKLFVASTLSHLRRENAAFFDSASFEPLRTTGPLGNHVVAFARQFESRWVVALVPRQMLQDAGPGHFALGSKVWGEKTSIHFPGEAPKTFTNALTGATVTIVRGRLDVASCLSELPLAVLVSE
jgi:(1->4)-alpha-D-glucan 1-alpha-D-glucosylmutase